MADINFEIITKGENVIGHKYLCTENDNEIEFYHVDGDVNDGEFRIGTQGMGIWTVIGKKDLFNFFAELGFKITQ
ncbi:MAG: hypothetical protein P9L97_06215 [Candidatus Tenebribacter davisii]|nr:hypothetical protein [Candidatus Tenebribacter davisii]